MLITTEKLAQHLDDPEWIIFDTRHDLMDPARGPRVYAEGHIPGAYFMHVDHDLSGVKTGKNGRHPLPDIDALVAKLNCCGLAPARQVAIYDDMGGNWAMRLWWLLRWLGHDAVAVLDGQFPLWVKEGRPVTKDVPPPRAGSFVPRVRDGATVNARDVNVMRSAPGVKVIDARATERYEGRVEPIDPVAGHIPGTANRFWQKNLAADGRFKSPDVLRDEYAKLLGSVTPDQAVHLCGSGVTACHNIFAMELAGLAGSRLYPGSWSEWCADPSRPVAQGPQDNAN
ncbi:sulfurtransferase [Usitatibacter palustris]|uniref:Thiosulfate sulfurtransferase SseB n=1 Tax=Usitatibacter palustris TaxID=2732487 RepID=A0A6M4HCZ2_9PROT|nr:sulfurtransferase [Usitatibacter palustris]QJR16598.1 Putative thiosulfate sulfurtransferase SseB [Usitatibacter palustris]